MSSLAFIMLLGAKSMTIMERIQLAVDQAEYQTVGMLVVLVCLGGLSLILAGTAKIATASAAKKAAKSAPAPVAAAPAAPVPAAQDGVTPELVAVISAAVAAALGSGHHVVEIKQAPHSYFSSGRDEIFSSHRIQLSKH